MTTPEELGARLATELTTLTTEHGVPGASVAVLVGDDVLEATAGVVNTRSGVAVTPDTLFMVQSITKVATATLVLQLAYDGLLALDDPVRHHLPGFRTADPEASELITVRHLLTHTGGFEGDLWSARVQEPDALARFVTEEVATARQVSPPGQRFSYCNAGYGTLGHLVEVLREMTYEQAVRRHLAEPLAIDELAFSADQALAFRTAIGHVGAGGTPPRPVRHWAVMPSANPAAGNQLAMSARGLLAFARMHLRDGRGPDGIAVVSADSARLMRQAQVRHPAPMGASSAHGLGWWVRRNGLAEHGGDAIGVSALLRTAPEHGVAAVVLTNGGNGSALIDDLLEPWFDDLPGVLSAAEHWSIRRRPTAAASLLDPTRYLGRYELRQKRVDVTEDAGRLRFRATPQHDLLAMAERAGDVAEVTQGELRPLGGELFLAMDDRGGEPHAVEFFDLDPAGRAQAVFNLDVGRTLPRVCSSVPRPEHPGETS